MAVKLTVVVLAALTIAAACAEREKRQSGGPDFSEYFNKFQEQMKPFLGQFPSLPNGFGSFPSFPGTGGSSGSTGGSSPTKRQASPNTISEWFNQFQEAGNNFPGNLPFNPQQFGQFGQFPFPGSSSGSSESSSENQNS